MSALRWAEIDLGALAHNISVLRQRVAPADLMVIVKANAYGHGHLEVARVAVEQGIRNLGTMDIPTALALRAGGISEDTTVFAWHYGPDEQFGEAIEAGITLGVSQPSELARIRAAAASRSVDIHIKIDTGLHRNGVTAENLPALVTEALALQDAGVLRLVGIWTHIAEASEEEDTLSVRRFEHAIEVSEQLGARFEVRHLAASSAGFRRDDVRFDLVRMGGHVWGIPSFDGITPAEMGLRPALSLCARVVAVEQLSDGTSRASLSIGYADGVPRRAAGRVEIAINGVRYPLEREVLHSSLTLDVDSRVREGDTAVLFGSGDRGEQTVREWGDLTGTLGDEIVARLGSRVHRVYSPES